MDQELNNHNEVIRQKILEDVYSMVETAVEDLINKDWILEDRPILKQDIIEETVTFIINNYDLVKSYGELDKYWIISVAFQRLQRKCFDVWDSKMLKDMADAYGQ